MDKQKEIEWNIQQVISPFGNDADLRERKKAIEFLLSAQDESFSVMMQLLKASPTAMHVPELINVLGLFKRDESIGLLTELMLQNVENVSRAAGRALGMIGSDSAREALEKGLASSAEEVNISAIEGLRVSHNKDWCDVIGPAMKHDSPNIRYYAVWAAQEIGCLDVAQLRMIAEQDPDPQIQKLCYDWIKNHN